MAMQNDPRYEEFLLELNQLNEQSYEETRKKVRELLEEENKENFSELFSTATDALVDLGLVNTKNEAAGLTLFFAQAAYDFRMIHFKYEGINTLDPEDSNKIFNDYWANSYPTSPFNFIFEHWDIDVVGTLIGNLLDF